MKVIGQADTSIYTQGVLRVKSAIRVGTSSVDKTRHREEIRTVMTVKRLLRPGWDLQEADGPGQSQEDAENSVQ